MWVKLISRSLSFTGQNLKGGLGRQHLLGVPAFFGDHLAQVLQDLRLGIFIDGIKGRLDLVGLRARAGFPKITLPDRRNRAYIFSSL